MTHEIDEPGPGTAAYLLARAELRSTKARQDDPKRGVGREVSDENAEEATR